MHNSAYIQSGITGTVSHRHNLSLMLGSVNWWRFTTPGAHHQPWAPARSVCHQRDRSRPFPSARAARSGRYQPHVLLLDAADCAFRQSVLPAFQHPTGALCGYSAGADTLSARPRDAAHLARDELGFLRGRSRLPRRSRTASAPERFFRRSKRLLPPSRQPFVSPPNAPAAGLGRPRPSLGRSPATGYDSPISSEDRILSRPSSPPVAIVRSARARRGSDRS